MHTFLLGKVILVPNVYRAEVWEKTVHLALEHRDGHT